MGVDGENPHQLTFTNRERLAQIEMNPPEELWFPEWEFGGAYWQKIDNYNKWSPHHFVKNWKTPLLVIHGQKDYRVDLSEGLQAFTAAQLQGIPSRLVYFPDEGH